MSYPILQILNQGSVPESVTTDIKTCIRTVRPYENKNFKGHKWILLR